MLARETRRWRRYIVHLLGLILALLRMKWGCMGEEGKDEGQESFKQWKAAFMEAQLKLAALPIPERTWGQSKGGFFHVENWFCYDKPPI